MEGRPDGGGGGHERHLTEDILRHGAQQCNEHQLVFLLPLKEDRLCLLLGIGAGAGGDGVGRRLHRAIDVAEEAMGVEHRDNLCLPGKKVFPCEMDRDKIADRGDRDRGEGASSGGEDADVGRGEGTGGGVVGGRA